MSRQTKSYYKDGKKVLVEIIENGKVVEEVVIQKPQPKKSTKKPSMFSKDVDQNTGGNE